MTRSASSPSSTGTSPSSSTWPVTSSAASRTSGSALPIATARAALAPRSPGWGLTGFPPPVARQLAWRSVALAAIFAFTRLAGKVLTTRERLQMHQEDAQCASCHRKIDPIGFGLENFDAVGQWRTEDTYQVMDDKGKPV